MSRNRVSKLELVPFLHRLKHQLYEEEYRYGPYERDLAHSYLNKVLDKLEEYRE